MEDPDIFRIAIDPLNSLEELLKIDRLEDLGVNTSGVTQIWIKMILALSLAVDRANDTLRLKEPRDSIISENDKPRLIYPKWY